MKLFVIVLGLVLAGCADSAPKSAEFQVPPGRYAEAFDAARDILEGYRFELDRVDASGGVISTIPKTTAGLATPWDDEQTTLEQEIDDAGNKQQRTVRILFDAGGGDAREATGTIAGRVEAVIERVRRPGWRLDTTSMRYTTFTRDPELQDRGLWPRYNTPIAQDPLLAGRVAEEIRKRLARAP